jgi:ubiquinone/menaquinone biosynthesis C-methylase UbiE
MRDTYRKVAEEKHQGIYRKHERIEPRISTLRSLSWPAYVWAKKLLSPLSPYNDVLVDLGGGTGNFSFLFRDIVKQIIVLDLVYAPLTEIKEPGTLKIQGDILEIPLKDESVSRVILNDVMEHFVPNDVPKLLKEMYRISRKDCKIFVNTSCYGFSLRRFYNNVLLNKHRKGRLDWADLKDGHFNRFKHSEMVGFFREHGFKIRNYRFSKHFFQPLSRILSHPFIDLRLLMQGNESYLDCRKNSLLIRPKGKRINSKLQTIINAWSYLDVMLLGRVEGGAVYYLLEK